jgi:uncharacterized membrane protein YfcA
MLFLTSTALAAIVAGAVASVSGFGIGSLLTPLLGLQVGTKLAVAAVSVPHAAGTALRFWMLRSRVDRRVLWTFGVMSAAGGLAGALLHTWIDSPWLTIVFGALLLFVAGSQWTDLSGRMRFDGLAAWVAGGLSGLLGGLVGNQGGIRAAALIGVGLTPESFVATSTAVGLIVDAARMPVYVATAWQDLIALWPAMIAAVAGVIAGTLSGHRLLRRLPPDRFRGILAALLAILGAAMLVSGLYAAAIVFSARP